MNGVNTEYRLLGYAASALVADAIPFLLVIRRDTGLRGYQLVNWSTAVGCSNELAELYVGDILQDLSEQVDGWTERAEFLFFSLGELSDGPVRTMESGWFVHPIIEDADQHSDRVLIECSAELLNSLIKATEVGRVVDMRREGADPESTASDG